MRVVSAVVLAFLCGMTLAAEPASYVIDGKRYYAVDEEALKKIGLPRQDIPDEKNGGTLLFRAIEMMPAEPQELKGPIEQAMSGPWRADFERLEPWLDEHDAMFAMIRKAVSLPDCQFPVLARTPDPDLANQPMFLYAVLLPHLAQLRQVARIGRLRGLAAEHAGEPVSGLDEHELVLEFGDYITGRDFIITDLVGIVCKAIGSKELSRCIVSSDLQAGAWEKLAKRLDTVRSNRRNWSRAILFEKVACIQASSPGVLAQAAPLFGGRGLPAGGKAARAFLKSRAARILLPDRTIKAEITAYYDGVADAAKLPPWRGLDAAEKLQQTIAGKGGDAPEISEWNVFVRMVIPAVSRFAEQHVNSLAQLDALRIAVALRRYGVAHARWPERLENLEPAWLKNLPPDPFTGNPYNYERKGDGWRLWSVGRNRKDDRGDPKEDVTVSCDRQPGRVKP